MKRKDIVYFARVRPTLGIYDVLELSIRTVENDWFTGMDKRDKRVYLFSNKDINKTIFINRKEALSKVKDAEKNKKEIKFTLDEE